MFCLCNIILRTLLNRIVEPTMDESKFATVHQDWHRKGLILHTRTCNHVLRCCFTVVTVNPSTCNFVSYPKPFWLKTLTVKVLQTRYNNVWKRLFDLSPYKFTIFKADSLFHSTHNNCTLKKGNGERQLCLCVPDNKL